MRYGKVVSDVSLGILIEPGGYLNKCVFFSGQKDAFDVPDGLKIGDMVWFVLDADMMHATSFGKVEGMNSEARE